MDDIEIAYMIISGKAFCDIDDYRGAGPDDPEKEILKVDCWNSLSVEAKGIIWKVIHSPDEVGVLTPFGRISVDGTISVEIYLGERIGYEKTQEIMTEVFDFINSPYFTLDFLRGKEVKKEMTVGVRRKRSFKKNGKH